jgi:hypothetical protein
MTGQPIFLKSRRMPISGAVALLLILTAVLLAAGCVGQAGNEKNASGNLTPQNPVTVSIRPSPHLLRTTITSYPGSIPDTIVDNVSIHS